MDYDNMLETKLRDYKPGIIGLKECHTYAVCIPLVETENGTELLFEVRSKKIKHQPGDICFPGGKVEEGETYDACALREMSEELLVKEEDVELLGLMDLYYKSPTLVYPYVARLHNYEGSFSKEEVDHTFTVPLSFFLEHEPDIYFVEAHVTPPDDFPYDKIEGGRAYPWRKRKEKVLFYEYGDYVIWGMTARIIHAFVHL